jgi:hypothetical protein
MITQFRPPLSFGMNISFCYAILITAVDLAAEYVSVCEPFQAKKERNGNKKRSERAVTQMGQKREKNVRRE